jgi:SAM-dependent methyltransferase
MTFKLENVVPWGRSMQEYIKMFDLQPDKLKLNILDCGGGPASFNAEMTQQGYNVISSDPIYQFTAAEIAQRVQDTYQAIIYGTKINYDRFVWQDIPSPEELGKARMTAMNKFIDDFPLGLQQNRYVTDELPNLSFNSNQFDLALCSHFLFTYSDNLSLDFHIAAINEMCRVAKEVRIFPLLVQFSGEVSPWLQPVIDEMQGRGYEVEIRQVAYEFQKGGDRLLRISIAD